MSTVSQVMLQFPIPRESRTNEPPQKLIDLQRTCPMAKMELFDGTPVWVATKHKDICQLLSADALSNACRIVPAERFSQRGYPELHSGVKSTDSEIPTFVHLDDPKHAEQRAMVESLFTREAVEKMRPQIQLVVDDLLENIIAKGCVNGPVNLVDDFAAPIPTRVVYSILGVPASDIPALSKASAIRVSTSGTATDADDKYLHDYMTALVDRRIRQPGNVKDDLISKLVVEQYHNGKISRDDVQRMAYLVLVAMNGAMISSIALGVISLLRHPKQLDALQKDESGTVASEATEEVLRYHTPCSLNSRRLAKQNVTVGGQVIKAGEGVIGAVQAGNRDPDIFSDPHSFDIKRDLNPDYNLAFGFGPHTCQAQWLSRVELEIAFNTLFKRLPGLRLAVRPEELEYTSATQNVGVVHLPVYF